MDAELVIPKKQTNFQKVRDVYQNITVEPAYLCFVLASALILLTIQNLCLEQACRVNLAYKKEICDALTRRDTANFTIEETMVQQLVAGMNKWKMFIQCGIPFVLILFWGSWSDRNNKRKSSVLIPTFAYCLMSVGLLLCTYFNTTVEWVIFTESVFAALSGDWIMMEFGVTNYITAISTAENRTFRIGLVYLCLFIGVPTGMGVSGTFLRALGFYGVFSITAVIYFCAFVYVLFMVIEPISPVSAMVRKNDGFADFFDWNHVIETLSVALKSGSTQRRLRIGLVVFILFIIDGPQFGEISMLYLFTRYRFNWDEMDHSIFSIYSMIMTSIGTLFMIGVLSKKLKLNDAMIGVISCTSKILSCFIFAFAVVGWHFYMGIIVNMLNSTGIVVLRSMATKLVSNNDVGKINSLVAVVELFLPIVYAPLYAVVYIATMHILPGTFFLISGALAMPAVIIFLCMYWQRNVDLGPFTSVNPPDGTVDERMEMMVLENEDGLSETTGKKSVSLPDLNRPDKE